MNGTQYFSIVDLIMREVSSVSLDDLVSDVDIAIDSG